MQKVKATHIMGGEVYYEYIDSVTYKVTMLYYVDCINGNAGAIESDKYAIFGIFNAKTFEFISTYSVLRNAPELVTEVNYECISNKPNACVHKYQYIQIVKIDPGNDGVIISFQRCCRNKTIDNIFDPEATGMTLFATIPPRKTKNSNPVFDKLPPNFLCNDAPLIFDHAATDADGDSLVYELFTPYLGANQADPRPNQPSKPPYQPITYVSPYHQGNMMGGSELLKIDRKTGKLTVRPLLTGQYVVGIKVSEYRNGVKIGETLRDYQFNVLPCILTTKAIFSVPEITCDMREISFKNTSDSAKKFHWDFGIQGENGDTSNLESPRFTYKERGTYKVRLVVENKNCRDTVSHTFEIGAMDSLFAKFELQPDTICRGSKIILKNKSTKTSDWWWDMGDGTDAKHNASVSSYEFTAQGSYIVKLRIHDTSSCNLDDSTSHIVTVLEPIEYKPSFKFSVPEPCLPNDLLFVKNEDFIQQWTWIIDDDTVLNVESIIHTFDANDLLGKVRLIPNDSAGKCEKYVEIDSVLSLPVMPNMLDGLLIPNVFTPNADNLNDCYQLESPYLACMMVKVLIFNRWGECLFNSEVDGDCWNGRNKNTGYPYPAGTYFGLISIYNFKGDKMLDYSNTITLIR